MSNSENSLRLFLDGFAARDIAEPLPSFDDTATATTIRTAMDHAQFEVVGIRKSGKMAGWLQRSDLGNESDPLTYQSIEPSSVIADTASLNEVIQKLSATSCLFVRSFNEVSGIIQIRDLQKVPMRMWLFGLVTITELRVTRMIDEVCSQGSWKRYLSEGRLQLANSLKEERFRRHQQPSLLDCLQLADKGQIVARDETLRRQTRFASRRAVEEFVAALQNLRNNLAHSQDISGDWEIIRDLAANVHRIVLGPPNAGSSAPAAVEIEQ